MAEDDADYSDFVDYSKSKDYFIFRLVFGHFGICRVFLSDLSTKRGHLDNFLPPNKKDPKCQAIG